MASTPPRKTASSLPFGSSASASAAPPNIKKSRYEEQLPYDEELSETRVLATSDENVIRAKEIIRNFVWQADEDGIYDEAATEEAKRLYDKYFETMVYLNQIDTFFNYLKPKVAKALDNYLYAISESRMAKGDFSPISMKHDVLPFLAPKRQGGRRITKRRRRSSRKTTKRKAI